MEHDIKLALGRKETKKKSRISPCHMNIFTMLIAERKNKTLEITQAYHIAKVTIHSFHQKMYEFKDS